MVVLFLTGFMAAFAFGMLYRVPQNQLLSAGIIGGLGWVIASESSMYVSQVVAVFIGAASVATLSEFWARRAHQPATLFLIPGIIPLVPGGDAYVTMLSFLQGDYVMGLAQLVSTVFLAGAIGGGIIVISSIFRYYIPSRAKIG